MLHLEFPPEFVHVAFTQLLGSNDFVSDNSTGEPQETSKFAVMGDYGNNINIYDSLTFIVVHNIQCQ